MVSSGERPAGEGESRKLRVKKVSIGGGQTGGCRLTRASLAARGAAARVVLRRLAGVHSLDLNENDMFGGRPSMAGLGADRAWAAGVLYLSASCLWGVRLVPAGRCERARGIGCLGICNVK